MSDIRIIRKKELNNNKIIQYAEWDNKNETPKYIDDLLHSYLIERNWNKFIKNGSTVIDIGAHSGDTLIPLILKTTDNGNINSTILCIEPNPLVNKILTKNSELNKDLCKIIILSNAITKTDNEDVILWDHGNDMCNGGIIHDDMSDLLKNKLNDIPNKKGVHVKGFTLGTICYQYLTPDELSKLNFIKIDTEGYDREIIESSKEFLNKYKPKVFLEWFDFYDYNDSVKLFNIIKDINYIAYDPISLKKADVDNKIWDLIIIHKDTDINDI